MRKPNRFSPMIVGAMLIGVAILAACAPSAAPASNANPGAPAGNAPATVAPTVTLQAPTPTQPPAPTPAPSSPNPAELLSKAFTALSSAKTMRLTIQTTTGGKTTTAVFEYVSPNAFHVIQPTGDEEIVIKDKGAYEKKGGKWSKLAIPANLLDNIVATVNPVSIIDKERQKLDQKTTPQVGADIVGGKPMVTYQYNNPQGKQGYIKFWYGATDGLLYRFEGSDQTTKGNGTIEYNIPISIAPPI